MQHPLTPSSRAPARQAGPPSRPSPAAGPRSAPPGRAGGRSAAGPRSDATSNADRPLRAGGPTRRQLVTAAVSIAVFLLCLTLVLLGARAAAAGGRPLPPPVPVHVSPDIPISPGQPLTTLPWGAAPGAVGIDPVGEGLRRAPWALAVAPDGRIAVLDAVNARVVTLGAEGAYLRDIPLDLADPRFIAADDLGIHVLDADTDRRLVSFAWTGECVDDLALPVLESPVSALFSQDGRPMIESAHRDVFTVTMTDIAIRTAATETGSPPVAGGGRPGTRPARLTSSPGRPLHAGAYGHARCRLADAATARVSLVALGSPPVDLPVTFPWAVEHLVSLDGDSRGNLIIGARVRAAEGRSSTGVDGPDGPPERTLLCIARLEVGQGGGAASAPAASGRAESAILLEALDGPAEMGQPYIVGPNGRVYQPVATGDGYTILAHDFPEE